MFNNSTMIVESTNDKVSTNALPFAKRMLSVRSCLHCKTNLSNNRKKYCSDKCKYWYNSIKKDNEKHLPPAKKRNENYFYMVIGSEWAKGSQRQGKRVNGMVTGSMAAMVSVTVEEVVPITKENIIRHFKGIQGFTPHFIRLGNMELIKKEDIKNRFGIPLE